MRKKRFTIKKKRGSGRVDKEQTIEEAVRELKQIQPANRDYREQSLRIHGLICAKCAREFDEQNKRLLTVHHRDGDHRNNPQDGSNWENLCVYCHEDEHSRERLGDYLGEE